MFQEPTIQIGDTVLSTPQAMTVRVAHDGHVPDPVRTVEDARACAEVVREFKLHIEQDGLGEDDTGKKIAAGYVYHARAVLELLESEFGTLT